jgi:hypothetical protein
MAVVYMSMRIPIYILKQYPFAKQSSTLASMIQLSAEFFYVQVLQQCVCLDKITCPLANIFPKFYCNRFRFIIILMLSVIHVYFAAC